MIGGVPFLLAFDVFYDKAGVSLQEKWLSCPAPLKEKGAASFWFLAKQAFYAPSSPSSACSRTVAVFL